MSQTAPTTNPTLLLFKRLVRLSFLLTLLSAAWVAVVEIQDSSAAWWLIAGVLLLPLLAFSGKVWRSEPIGLIWLCFLLFLYFIKASVDFMVNPANIADASLGLTSVLLFTCILIFVRLNAKARKLQTAAEPI